MGRVLYANFARMWKSKPFWVCVLFMLGFGAFVGYNQYRELPRSEQLPLLDHVFFGYAALVGILCAVFCSLFIGTEYSDGTIRNKLIVGRTRCAIYLGNLITSIVAALLMCAAFIVSVCVLGIPLLGPLKSEPKFIAQLVLGCVAMTIAFCALYTMLSMLNSNKTVVVIVALVGVFALMLAATAIQSRLAVPEFYDEYILSDSFGNIRTETVANPDYLRGTKRAAYVFLFDFLPTGQALQYANLTAVHLWQMSLYSLAIALVSTGFGLFFFRRKDLK